MRIRTIMIALMLVGGPALAAPAQQPGTPAEALRRAIQGAPIPGRIKVGALRALRSLDAPRKITSTVWFEEGRSGLVVVVKRVPMGNGDRIVQDDLGVEPAGPGLRQVWYRRQVWPSSGKGFRTFERTVDFLQGGQLVETSGHAPNAKHYLLDAKGSRLRQVPAAELSTLPYVRP